MSETCHYCHEPITRHESISEVMDWDDQGNRQDRIYHDDCHHLDIYEHRERGERLPEDQPGPPMTGVVVSSGYSNEQCRSCGASGHLSCTKFG